MVIARAKSAHEYGWLSPRGLLGIVALLPASTLTAAAPGAPDLACAGLTLATTLNDLLFPTMAPEIAAYATGGAGLIGKPRCRDVLAVSERLASWAVRAHDPELIILGLVALGRDGGRGDWRDSTALIALHHDAAYRISMDAGSLFEQAAASLSPKAADGVRVFLPRAAADRTFQVLDYEAGSDAVRFPYPVL